MTLFAAAIWLLDPSGSAIAAGDPPSQFPTAPSKKGLQVEMVEDALDLGVKHATFNFNLSQLIAPAGGDNTIEHLHNGRPFHFNRPYVQSMDRNIKTLSDHGVLVYLIVLAYQSSDPEVNRLALHPDYDKAAPNRLGAFNTVTEDGAAWFEASLDFMSARWSRPNSPHGRVVGYILGNEVNSHWWWSNMGEATMEEFADDYARAVRLAHAAVRRNAPWPRIYISLEHHWNISFPAGNERQSFSGRPFLEYFATRIRASGDIDWHLAYHPYPENLFEPRFWNDKSATASPETPRITFKNLEVLMGFMRRPAMLFEGQPRRIILSEQGFHTPDSPDGERIQAAAFCYAYRKVDALDGIDAFILHRHVDHPREGGLMLGLRKLRPADGSEPPKKLSWECFRLADTPHWRNAFEFALPIIGFSSWEEALNEK